jgi:hypothetical protein
MINSPMLACFEGEAPTPTFTPTPPASPPPPPTSTHPALAPPVTPVTLPPPAEDQFTQDDVNKFLAEDRRKHQDKYKTLETSYQQILDDKTLASEQRVRIETELQDLQKSFRTKEQQAEFDKKQQRNQYETDLATEKANSERWEGMYKNQVIRTSLQDAAIKGEAFNSNQIISLLEPMAQLRDEVTPDGATTGRLVPVIDFADIDETTGDPTQTLRTPTEAVQRMKELTELYGNLFRANVVSGVGAGSATGGATPGKSGSVDVSKLTSAQYRELRAKNPELLGLRPRN